MVSPEPARSSGAGRGAARPRIPLGVLFLCLVLIACAFDGSAQALRSGDPTPALLAAPTVTPPLTPPGAPQVVIVTPANDTFVVDGAPLTISFSVDNFSLAPFNGSASPPRTGQLDVLVDGTLYEVVSQVAPVVLPLAPGAHDVSLRLVNTTGVVSVPGGSSFLEVEMTDGPSSGVPEVVVWAPSPGQVIQGDEATLSFYVANFAIVPPRGQADAPNEGHIHAYLDNVYFAMITVEQAFVITGLTPGQHTIELLMVNNDHTPYSVGGSSSEITASTTFTVVAEPASGTITTAQAAMLEVASFATLGISVLVLVVVVLLRTRGGGGRAGTTPSGPKGGPTPRPASPTVDATSDDRE